LASQDDVEDEQYFVSQIDPFGVDVDRAQVNREIEQSNVGVRGLWEIRFHSQKNKGGSTWSRPI
jgi:hypothetical protein